MKGKFNRERIRFHVKKKNTWVIQGWFEDDAEGKEQFGAVMNGRELPLEVKTQRGVEVTKKYLRYKTNVMVEYFLNIELPEDYEEAGTLRVYHEHTCIYHASGQALGKLSRHLESWMEGLRELPDGRYENLLEPETFLRVESGLLSLNGHPAVLRG